VLFQLLGPFEVAGSRVGLLLPVARVFGVADQTDVRHLDLDRQQQVGLRLSSESAIRSTTGDSSSAPRSQRSAQPGPAPHRLHHRQVQELGDPPQPLLGPHRVRSRHRRTRAQQLRRHVGEFTGPPVLMVPWCSPCCCCSPRPAWRPPRSAPGEPAQRRSRPRPWVDLAAPQQNLTQLALTNHDTTKPNTLSGAQKVRRTFRSGAADALVPIAVISTFANNTHRRLWTRPSFDQLDRWRLIATISQRAFRQRSLAERSISEILGGRSAFRGGHRCG
jgi:hypothetical protein